MAQQYLDHSKAILTSQRSNFKGGSKESGIISLFGYQDEYDLREGYPLLTTKKMATKSMLPSAETASRRGRAIVVVHTV